MHLRLGYLLVISFLAFTDQSSAVTYYVCNNATTCNKGSSGWKTGSDSYSAAQARSKATPFKSIDYAADLARAGDTVIVGSGVYSSASRQSKSFIMYIQNSGKSGYPITIKSESKWGAVIDGKNSLHSGIYFACGSNPASYTRIEGFEIRNFRAYGVMTKDSNGSPYDTRCRYLELRDLRIHHVAFAGFELEAMGNSVIERNLVHNLTAATPNGNLYHGIYLSDNTEDILVKNNIVYGCPYGWPVHIYDLHNRGARARYHKIINNTLINDSPYRDGGIVLLGFNHVVRNNIMYDRVRSPTSSGGMIADGSNSHVGTIIENNISNMPKLCNKGCPGVTQSGNLLNTSLNSEFLSSSSQNFHLSSTAKSINRGTLKGYKTRSGAPINDFDRRQRYLGSAPDVGAYELK